jgi:hypothetical protein
MGTSGEMLIIFIIVCSLLLVFWISIEFSYALYFGHDIPIVISGQNLSLSPKQISTTEKGDVYLVWVDKNNTYFTSSNNSGNKFAPKVLLSDSNKSLSTPQIAATEKGDVYVVWVDKNNIYFTSSNNSGNKFAPKVLLSDSNKSSSTPQIAATEKGDVYLVWVDKNNKTGDSDITFRSSNDSGISFDDRKKLTGGKSVSFFPQITTTEKGGVYLVWVDKNNKTGEGDIEFTSSNDSGKTFSHIKELRGGDTLSFSPQIAATEKGDVHVVWVDKGTKTGDNDISFRTSHDAGRAFDDRKKLRSNNLLSFSPQMVATERGEVFVVWTDINATSAQSQISYRASHDSGRTFERVIDLNKDVNNLSNYSSPQIATTGNNSVYVTWVDNNQIEFSQILVNDSLVGRPISLNNKSTSSLSPEIVQGANGNVYVIWIDKNNAVDRSIHIKRISEFFFDRNS